MGGGMPIERVDDMKSSIGRMREEEEGGEG
jgi:hypothetical protein